MADNINVTISSVETINVTMAEAQPINVTMTATGPQGPSGPTGPIDPNSHTHADPKATTRVMTYVPEFQAYQIVE